MKATEHILASTCRLLRRTSTSVFVLTLMCLIVFDLAIARINPLRYLNSSNCTSIHQNPVVDKLPLFMNSLSNPDVEILGSSLVLVPMVHIDDGYHHVRTRYDSWYNRNHILEYTHADYFQHQLSQALHQPIDVINLGVVASVMSDHYIISKRPLLPARSRVL